MAEACGGRGKGGQAEREAGPTARWGVGSIHWGNLWRVSIKAVDELTFKENGSRTSSQGRAGEELVEPA